MTIAWGLFFVIIIVLGTVWIFYRSKEDREQEAEMEKKLADEYIYDPETGARMTLEQAEKGHFIQHDFPHRVKTDEEIEKHYDEDEREIEYIRRYFAERKITETEDQHAIEYLLYGSETAKLFKTFDVHYLWEYLPEVYVGLIYVSNYVYETQLVIVLEQLNPYKIDEPPAGFEIEHKDDWTILRPPGKAKYKDLLEFIGQIN